MALGISFSVLSPAGGPLNLADSGNWCILKDIARSEEPDRDGCEWKECAFLMGEGGRFDFKIFCWLVVDT